MAPNTIPPAIVIPASHHAPAATAKIVIGIATKSSRMVGVMRSKESFVSIRRPVPNSATITVSSLMDSQRPGWANGSSGAGIAGRNKKATAPDSRIKSGCGGLPSREKAGQPIGIYHAGADRQEQNMVTAEIKLLCHRRSP